MPTSDPIREQLAEARRNQILDAAAAVFAASGFHSATTKEIAQTAGVSEGTIYNYFDTKFDLLIGLVARLGQIEQLPSEMMDARQGDVRSFFVAAFRHRLNRIEQGGEVLQAILPQVFVNPDLREQFYHKFVGRIAAMLEQYVQSRIEQGHVRPVDVPLTVRLLQAMFVGLLALRIFGDEIVLSKWQEIPELMATLLFDGLDLESEG